MFIVRSSSHHRNLLTLMSSTCCITPAIPAPTTTRTRSRSSPEWRVSHESRCYTSFSLTVMCFRNYMYLLQFSGKPLSILGAAATLLDAIATSTVSSATASTYLHDELSNFPVSLGVLAIVFLLAIGILVAIGGRDSNILSASVFVFHVSRTVRFKVILAQTSHTACDSRRSHRG